MESEITARSCVHWKKLIVKTILNVYVYIYGERDYKDSGLKVFNPVAQKSQKENRNAEL